MHCLNTSLLWNTVWNDDQRLDSASASSIVYTTEGMYQNFLDRLEGELAATKPVNVVAAGALRGLNGLLDEFHQGECQCAAAAAPDNSTLTRAGAANTHPDVRTLARRCLHCRMFFSVLRAMDLSLRSATVLDAPRAALQVLARHGGQFPALMLEHYTMLYRILKADCMHHNNDFARDAYEAMDTFLLGVVSTGTVNGCGRYVAVLVLAFS